MALLTWDTDSTDCLLSSWPLTLLCCWSQRFQWHSNKNVFLDYKFARPSLPHAGGQELVCKVRIHMSSDWSEDRTRIDQRRHWVCSLCSTIKWFLGLAITGLSATEKQGNINQDVNPKHCAECAANRPAGVRLFYCQRRVLKTTCRLYEVLSSLQSLLM